MKDKFEEIYENTIPHSSFLSKNAVMDCMEQSHELGRQDVLEWLSKMDYLSDNINYILEEWKNQNNKK
jgi:hypothetical protein